MGIVLLITSSGRDYLMFPDSQMLLIADHFGCLKHQIIPSRGSITKHIMILYRNRIQIRVWNFPYTHKRCPMCCWALTIV
jgi:hypothetical protein